MKTLKNISAVSIRRNGRDALSFLTITWKMLRSGSWRNFATSTDSWRTTILRNFSFGIGKGYRLDEDGASFFGCLQIVDDETKHTILGIILPEDDYSDEKNQILVDAFRVLDEAIATVRGM